MDFYHETCIKTILQKSNELDDKELFVNILFHFLHYFKFIGDTEDLIEKEFDKFANVFGINDTLLNSLRVITAQITGYVNLLNKVDFDKPLILLIASPKLKTVYKFLTATEFPSELEKTPLTTECFYNVDNFSINDFYLIKSVFMFNYFRQKKFDLRPWLEKILSFKIYEFSDYLVLLDDIFSYIDDYDLFSLTIQYFYNKLNNNLISFFALYLIIKNYKKDFYNQFINDEFLINLLFEITEKELKEFIHHMDLATSDLLFIAHVLDPFKQSLFYEKILNKKFKSDYIEYFVLLLGNPILKNFFTRDKLTHAESKEHIDDLLKSYKYDKNKKLLLAAISLRLLMLSSINNSNFLNLIEIPKIQNFKVHSDFDLSVFIPPIHDSLYDISHILKQFDDTTITNLFVNLIHMKRLVSNYLVNFYISSFSPRHLQCLLLMVINRKPDLPNKKLLLELFATVDYKDEGFILIFQLLKKLMKIDYIREFILTHASVFEREKRALLFFLLIDLPQNVIKKMEQSVMSLVLNYSIDLLDRPLIQFTNFVISDVAINFFSRLFFILQNNKDDIDDFIINLLKDMYFPDVIIVYLVMLIILKIKFPIIDTKKYEIANTLIILKKEQEIISDIINRFLAPLYGEDLIIYELEHTEDL